MWELVLRIILYYIELYNNNQFLLILKRIVVYYSLAFIDSLNKNNPKSYYLFVARIYAED